MVKMLIIMTILQENSQFSQEDIWLLLMFRLFRFVRIKFKVKKNYE